MCDFCLKKKCLKEVCKNDSHNFIGPKQTSFPKTGCNYDSKSDIKIAKNLIVIDFLRFHFKVDVRVAF